MQTQVNRLVKQLLSMELTISLAESVTCGLASHQLNTVKGTSEIFRGSIVCYDEKVKTSLLGVKPGLIRKFTAESQQVTDSLAQNLSTLIKADVQAAITGLASPGASATRSKPVGTVFISVVFRKKIHRLKKRFYGSPTEIRKKSCNQMYSFIYSVISA